MADVFTKEKRSEVMSRIRGTGNRETELAMAKLCRLNGLVGWRRHRRVKLVTAAKSGSRLGLYARPDFIFSDARVAVFVDGCFWHCCPKHSKLPATNTQFWQEKLAANKSRDRLVNRRMRNVGWVVLRIWEHQLTANGDDCIRRVKRALALAKSGLCSPSSLSKSPPGNSQ